MKNTDLQTKKTADTVQTHFVYLLFNFMINKCTVLLWTCIISDSLWISSLFLINVPTFR